jgi:hypothetical protein
VPWVPQTVFLPVDQKVHPDDPTTAMEKGIEPGRDLLEANPDWQLDHTHDANQDRLMVRALTYFRVKRRALGERYEQFIVDRLPPGGTLLVMECTRSWNTTRIGDRHVFQHGAVGGATEEEFHHGSERVEEYLERYDSPKRRWDGPHPDTVSPEAEWGFEESLREDVLRLARERDYRVRRIQRPFAEQVELLAAQVEDLEEPVTILAHSQAAWVAWQAASDDRLEGVTDLVLVGPFPSSPTGFPPPGRSGPGRVGGDLFRVLEPVPELADFAFEVDAPLTHELLAAPDAAGEVFSQPLPEGTRALAVTASSDLALMPDGWRIDQATDACPVREAHPYLPLTPALHHAADRFLDGDRGREPCPLWPELYRRASQALGAPPAHA